MNSDITTSIVIDKRSIKPSGKCPVKLRVTFNREPRVFGISQFLSKKDYNFLTEEEYKKVYSDKPRGTYKDMLLEYSLLEQKSRKMIDSIENFSFEEFKTRFYRRTTDTRNVYHYYDSYIEKLEKEGRIGTAGNYKGSLSSIKRFSGKEVSLDFSKITIGFLEKYEQWMKENDNSVATVGFYLRPLRAICRMGIKDGGMKPESYPFEKDKYQIPRKKNIKKALDMNEIAALLNYEREEFSIQDMAIDFWVLSYLCNGANIKDLLNLKYKDIGNETITFVRAKTERSKKEQESISVPLIDKIVQIIEKWGVKPQLPENYVFSVLNEELTPAQEYERIKSFVKKINTNIQPIAESLKISKKVTTYTARHSFSTVLKRAGASTELIKESLGHSSMQTTENYLDSFENEVKKEFAMKLLPEMNSNKSDGEVITK